MLTLFLNGIKAKGNKRRKVSDPPLKREELRKQSVSPLTMTLMDLDQIIFLKNLNRNSKSEFITFFTVSAVF